MSYFHEHNESLRFPLARQPDTSGLRAAQIAAAHALSAHFFSRKEPALVVMPTGSGKTCVMLLAAFLLRARRVLALTPSRTVRDQIGEAFEELALLRSVGALDDHIARPIVRVVDTRPTTVADWTALADCDVVVGTVQCMSPAIAGVAQPPSDFFDVVFCDEAHHEPAPTWRALLDHFANSKKALFTATPFRRDEKVLRGRIVFDYPLAKARDDGVFGRLEYIAVEPAAGLDNDVALARAASAQLAVRRSSGLRDLVMVRTAQRSRAESLAELYERETSMRLRTVYGSHSQKHVRSIIKSLRAGDLDGVICVDMLGEGFDLPELKLGVLHSPHKSLAVTLQFIGRFARTTAVNTGHAGFLAIPSEIESEAQPLFVPGAEWNEIVETASRQRIDAERESREVLETFQRPSTTTTDPAEDIEVEVDLASITPYFHVKILEVTGGVDLDLPFVPPVEGEPILLRRSTEHQALVCVTRDASPCRWTRGDQLVDVQHDLFVLFFDEPSGLLFVCTSRRDVAVYDEIAAQVAPDRARRLAPEELNRVLRDVANPAFFSVGMRNRSAFGFGESYRMITGKAADKAIQKSDGRFYDRGHCFGRGEDQGATITIGFSSASKVWANRWDNLPQLFNWCKHLAAKLVDARTVQTTSGLDHLPLGKRVTTFPERIVAIDWNEEVYRRERFALILSDPQAPIARALLLDLTLRPVSVSGEQVIFAIEGQGVAINVEYRLDRPRWFASMSTDSISSDEDGRRASTLLAFLHEHPPAFYAADLSRIEGDTLSSSPQDPGVVFDVSAIEEVNWGDAGVDALLEKPNGTAAVSIFEWLQARLIASSAEVVFNDDGSGEIADFVAITASASGSHRVTLYHCKAASRLPIPGDRVDDLYEVAGQAVKSVRYGDPDSLRRHLLHRITTTAGGASRLVKGTRQDIDRLLADGVGTAVSVTIVQPGIGRALRGPQSSLLAAANAYMIAGQLAPLAVVGSTPSRRQARS